MSRMGAIAGILFVILVIVSFATFAGFDSEPSDSSAAIAADLENDQDLRDASGYAGLFGWLSFFWFLAYFRSRLQKAEGEGGWLTSVAFGGGLVAAAVLLIAASLNFATTAISDYGPDTQVAKTLLTLSWNYIWVIAPPLIAMTAAASIIIVRFGALPRWIGWIGILPTVTLLAPWVGVFFFLLWILIVSAAASAKTAMLTAIVSHREVENPVRQVSENWATTHAVGPASATASSSQ